MLVDIRFGPREVTVDGWVALPANDIQSVWLTVDGVLRVPVELGLATPRDGAGQALMQRSDAGWRAQFDRDEFDVGVHRIGALVLRGYGLVESLQSREVEFPPIEDVSEAVAAGEVLDVRVGPQRVVVEGWAAVPANEIRCVWLTVDGAVRAQAETGLPTPRGDGNVPLTDLSDVAGWSVTLDRDDFTVGVRNIGALALLERGVVERLDPKDVNFLRTGMIGFLDEPAPDAVVGEVLNVRGWF